ncbi:MAG: hypothetical protein LBH76_06470, partial [Propionibacteriaceae bacterium]|nr:hypothetical protein [Propionibacteriaceae bacterium]
MTSLLTATPAAIATLDDRSRVTCVVYADHPLPAGARPASADIGVETTGPSTLLHVKRGLAYDGDDPGVRHWIETGTCAFPSVAECVAWVQAKIPRPRAPRPAGAEPRIARLPADQVTDLDAIRLELPPAPSPGDLAGILAGHVLGQDAAVRGLAETAAYHVAKPYPRRPASALLIGATGTGKTLAAEQLASHLATATGSEWSYQ